MGSANPQRLPIQGVLHVLYVLLTTVLALASSPQRASTRTWLVTEVVSPVAVAVSNTIRPRYIVAALYYKGFDASPSLLMISVELPRWTALLVPRPAPLPVLPSRASSSKLSHLLGLQLVRRRPSPGSFASGCCSSLLSSCLVVCYLPPHPLVSILSDTLLFYSCLPMHGADSSPAGTYLILNTLLIPSSSRPGFGLVSPTPSVSLVYIPVIPCGLPSNGFFPSVHFPFDSQAFSRSSSCDGDSIGRLYGFGTCGFSA